jgi:hypothetical protein
MQPSIVHKPGRLPGGISPAAIRANGRSASRGDPGRPLAQAGDFTDVDVMAMGGFTDIRVIGVY